MKALFIHQNFPGQFRHLAQYLARNPANTVIGLGEPPAIQRNQGSLPGVRMIAYPPPRETPPSTHHYLRSLESNTLRGQNVVRACLDLKKQGFTPDIVFAHAGWGEGLFLRDIFPTAKIVAYAEFYYHGQGTDLGFDPEFPVGFDRQLMMRMRNATQLVTLSAADAGWSPTEWQKSVYPPELRDRITVIHEGIDTGIVKPDPEARWTLPNGRVLTREDEVLTLVNRSMEPYRGFHIFMRALPEIQGRRPQAQTLIIGCDERGYGSMPQGFPHWRAALLKELEGKLDLSRIHFLGNVPYDRYLKVIQLSRAHVYLTYPFVLSWSMLESMAAGCTLIASATPPVTEVVRDGENGLLFDFFDKNRLAELASEVLAHPERFASLRESARKTIVEGYDFHTRTLPAQLAFVERLLAGG